MVLWVELYPQNRCLSSPTVPEKVAFYREEMFMEVSEI